MDFGILWPTDVTIRLVDITTNSTMVTVFFATSPKLCNVHRKTSFAGGKFGNFFLLFCPHVSRNKETRLIFLFKGNSPTDLFFIRDIKLCSTARTTKSTISKWANYKKKASIESTKFAQQNL